MKNLLLWIWLSLSCTPGSPTFKKLISEFETVENIYTLNEKAISSVISRRNADYSSLINKDTSRAREILSFCTEKHVGIVTYGDKEYPATLKEIDTPPVLLYYRGVLPDFNKVFPISVVGMRRLSDYGRKNAFEVSRDLALCGATIVSGMAIGIDGVAHAGALSTGAATVAVIGSGIDVCYPSQHVHLAREIVKCGCVLTEYPPATPPYGDNFPVRNRIISGLSDATLVVEGNERSGALITARCAKKQGRYVFALPGNVGSRNSLASNLLIKNGANLFTSADDVIEVLDKEYTGKLNPFKLSDGAVDMNEYLTKYRVSCVTPGDSIFRAPRAKKQNETEPTLQKREAVSEQTVASSPSIDAKTLALYKKIPQNGAVDMNSLIGEEHSLKDVMQGMLKLEMLKFVTLLPGDRVERKFK